MENKATFKEFGKYVLKNCNSLERRAVAFTYFHSRFNNGRATLSELVADFDSVGLGKPRLDRLRGILTKSRYTKKVSTDCWMVSADKFREVELEFNLEDCATEEKEVPSLKKSIPTKKKDKGTLIYIDSKRISELKKITSTNFDLTRLLRICLEINANFSQGNNTSTILLVRTLLDHIAPIFGFKSFVEIANNYSCGKSLKDTLQHLENSSRKIADGHLHTPIRKKEVLPTPTQVNFSQDIDVLLGEIVRILK